jgi:HK97 gp10 family phage protein
MSSVRGFNKLRAKFRELDKKVAKQKLVEIGREGGQIVAERAQELAPRSSGSRRRRGKHGAESIKARVRSRRPHEVHMRIGFTKRYFYLRFFEYGTSKLSPRPFLRPAIDQTRGQVLDLMARRFREVLGAR